MFERTQIGPLPAHSQETLYALGVRNLQKWLPAELVAREGHFVHTQMANARFNTERAAVG